MPALEHADSRSETGPLRLQGQRVCVAAPLSFTEACFSVPAIRALRSLCPQATLAVLCPAAQLPMWKRGIAELDHVLYYQETDPVRKIVALLEELEEPFDAAIIWEAGTAAKALKKAGVLQRVGYPASKLEKWLTDTISVASRPGPVEHRVRYYLDFLKQLGADAFVRSSFEMPSLPPPPAGIQIALAPLSEYGSAYQWPAERFMEVIDVINTRYPEVMWTIFDKQGGDGDSEELRAFEHMLGESDADASDDWEREGFFDQLAGCTALLACDGEIAHMAAHIGLPAAVIFGPSAPEWRRPLGKQNIVIREHVACSPCYMAKCPLDSRCQSEVSVDMVVEGLEQAIRMRQG